MDQDVIVEQLMNRCKGLIGRILNAQDLKIVAATSLVILKHMREVAHAILQATVDLEAGQLKAATRCRLLPAGPIMKAHPSGFVVGSSIFVGSSGAVNPTLTPLALALRTADYLMDQVL